MKRRLIRKGASFDAILLSSIKFITLFLGIVITRLLSQYLSVHAYGTYSQVMMLVSSISYLAILGMIDGVNYFNCSERDPKKREAYISTLFCLQCIVSAVAGTILFLGSGLLCRYFDNPELKRLLIFAAILPFFQNILQMLQVLIVSIGRAKILAIRNLFVSLVRLTAVIAIIALSGDIAVVFTTVAVMDVCQMAVFLPMLKKNQCTVNLLHADFSLVKRIAYYCGPMAVFISINSVNRDLDKYLIALVTDTETVALYANASKQLPFDIIMTSFCTVLQPEITRLVAERKMDKAIPLYKMLLEIALIPNVIMCGAAIAAAPALMQFLYSDKYLAGLTIFCIYIAVDLIRFSNMTLVLSAAGETRKVMFIGLGTVVLNGMLNIVLYDAVGLIGPACATLITTFLSGAVMIKLSAKAMQCRVHQVMDFAYICKLLAHGAVAMAVSVGLRTWLEKFDLHYFVVLVLTAGTFCALMALLHGKRLLQALRAVNRVSRSQSE